MGIGKMVVRFIKSPEVQAMIKPVTKSTPTPVDVSAAGMAMEARKTKTLKGARGTGVTYSGVKTSSQGLLTGAKTEKKTLLGG
jgi:hypothetical protein